MTVGERIRKTRIDAKMTQKQLGELCGMADSAIRKYESGKVIPKYETLERIANALDVSVAYLQGIELFTPSQIVEALANGDFRKVENMAGLQPGTILPIPSDLMAEFEAKLDGQCFSLDYDLNKIRRFFKLIEKYVTPENMATYQNLIEVFAILNPDGQRVAVERVEELTEIPKYQRDPDKQEQD